MNNKSLGISRGGLFTALSVIFLYLSSILITNRLGFMILTSIVLVASIISIKFKYSFLVYISTSIICFIIGLRGVTFAYLILFGLYPFVKYKIESLRKTILEFFLKFIFINVTFFLSYYLYSYLFLDLNSLIKFPMFIFIIGIEICFLIYDYILTLISQYIIKRFKFL